MAEIMPQEDFGQTPRAPWNPEPPLPAEPVPPRRGAAAVRHFLAWAVLGVAAVLVVSFTVQIVAAAFGTAAIVLRGGAGTDSDISSHDMLALMIASQLASIAIFAPWWMRARRRGLGIARSAVRVRGWDAKRASGLAGTLFGIVLMGIGLQVLISLALNLILPLFPEILREYTELMAAGGTDEFSLLSVLSVAILAPISEELTDRGVALQFALRGVSPSWRSRLAPEAYAKISIGSLRFWAANVIQALGFAILHLNIVQGVYAFAIGLVLGWMFGRTGMLRYGVALHLAINFSSYFVNELYTVFGALGDWGIVVFPLICLGAGLRLFTRAVPVDSGAAFARVECSTVPGEPVQG